ncbi:hypothetical protein EYF80_015471 [Liparis tanakae]|uniref:Uncharacterized protein n=1 Tax=Liparis tanakae TaxID=230148 RepID=A0A4Z2I8E3_9TELE|nr:hypothetical protein EYF80_015471 [Liparis tanakae]
MTPASVIPSQWAVDSCGLVSPPMHTQELEITDWISLFQRGAVTLGRRALHGPAGSHVGLK